MVLGQGLLLSAMGGAIGIAAWLAVASWLHASRMAASLGLSEAIARTLFGVDPTDPITLVVCAVLLTVIALAACYLPARRATRVDPMVALRYE
jgi:ABC-type antimicrobial peptide transport system permease subunit